MGTTTASSTSEPCWGVGVDDPGLVEPGDRGSLTVADRVIDKLAAHAASFVDGVVPAGSVLDRLAGRQLPRATSQVRGRQARVGVQIAVVWPKALAETAGEVRQTVARELTRLSGLSIVAVDVTVDRVELPSIETGRRIE